MGRRRKTAGVSKLPAKVNAPRRSARRLLAEKVVDSDESSHNQDDSVSSPSQEICPEEVHEEPPSQEDILEISPADIVHKKFGKLRCLVEADSEGSEQLEEVAVEEEVDTTLDGVTELVWDEEIIEETVVCEGIDAEDTRSPNGSLLHEDVDSQDSDINQENMLEIENSNVTSIEFDDQELGKDSYIPQQVPAHHQVFLAEDIEITDAPEKEFEPVCDELYYCESEDNSKDADSQSSSKGSGVGTEIFDTEVGVGKLKIGDIAFLDNSSSVGLLETVECQSPAMKSLPSEKDLDDEEKCNWENEGITKKETISTESPVKTKMSTRSCKKMLSTDGNPINVTNIFHDTGTTENIECSMIYSTNDEPVKHNETRDMEIENEEIIDNDGLIEACVEEEHCKGEEIFHKLIVINSEQEKPSGETEENIASQLQVQEESVQRRPDEEESERKQATPTFRSRSGSTDTTGSESSSNCSSGIRRSSRIRSISVLKQRTRSRFDSVSTSSDAKVADSRDSSDGNSGTEAQSDKENSSIKVPAPMGVHSCVSSGSNKHTENFKPVKVKSRWRRSSELEMGGNRSSDSDVAVTPPMPSCVSPHLITSQSLTLSPQFGVVSSPVLPTIQSSEIITDVLNDEDIPIPPTKESHCDYVQEVNEDKEMEERLRQFEHLKENDYLTERTICKEAKRMVCDCFLTKEEIVRGELGCGEDCLNRLLMIECGSRCTLGERCTNKHFQKQEYSTCEVFRTEKKGFGLRAIGDLSSGSFIMEYVGEVLNPKEFRRRAKDYSKDKNRHYYFMALKSDSIIDATMKGNISRFINHSCDPNSETQKWTVNGELRIGFFTSRNVSAGEEITFDYQFQRYGKEAQRCFCESPLCRGWIGEDPEKENEKPERKERKEREVKKKRAEKKHVEEEFLDDIDLEEEIEKLYVTGLKNRTHTVTLCRLMVRGRDTASQVQLLQLIQQGEPACRRLFLDYHGLKLIASWIPDTIDDSSQTLCIEILKTLAKLPIPNKTVLQDSKVLSSVEKWSKILTVDLAPDVETASSTTPVDQEVKSDVEEQEESKVCEDEEMPAASPVESVKAPDNDGNMDVAVVKEETPKDESDKKEPTIRNLALVLMTEWSTLKEVFRIPKKERIEQMKEHEREADRGYKEYLDKENSPDKQSYDRWRQRSSDYDKRDRKKIKESPETEKIRKSRFDDRGPKLTKQERRQQFAMKVALQEEADRRRQQHDDLWRGHEEQCLEMGLDPNTVLAFDPETNQRCLYDQATHTWLPYDDTMEEAVHPAGLDPGHPGSLQYDPNNPANMHFDPNNPHHVQYDPNNPTHNQFNPNAQFDLNNPVSGQFEPSNSASTQYDSNNILIPTIDNIQSQHPPNFPINSHQFDSNNAMSQYDSVDPHDAIVKQEMNAFDSYTCDNPPLPVDKIHPPLPSSIVVPPIPSDLNNLPLPIDGNKYQDVVKSQIEGITNLPDVLVKSVNQEAEDDILPEDDQYMPTDVSTMPPKWRCAVDDLGRTYYYHIIIRIPQWFPPWEEIISDQSSDSSEESSEEDASEENEEEDEEGTSSSEEEDDIEAEIQVKSEAEVAHEDFEDDDKVLDQKTPLKQDSMEDTEKINESVHQEFTLGKHDIAAESEEKEFDGITIKSEVIERKLVDETFEDEETDEKEELVSKDLEEDMEVGETEEDLGAPTLSVDQSEPMDLEDDDADDDEVEEEAHHEETSKKDRRREGLVQERIISPRRDEDRPEKKNYREIKEKLRRKKELARKARAKKKRRDAKERTVRKADKSELPSATDPSSETARKIKDNFRLQMAGAMVQYLNPYRKPDCKQGRINNTDDFKHLARKLTHFVMVKELKHCRSVEDLDCNDNVKHKARDFIKKYMSKFGPVYHRPTDDE